MATKAYVELRAKNKTDLAFDKVNKNLAKLGKMAGAAAGSFAILGAAFSIRQFAAFEKSIAEVNTLLGKDQNIKDYEKSIRALSHAFGTDQSQQAKAMYQVISAGAKNAAVATEILAQANALALGGVTEIETAADGLTSVMNAYGSEANEAAGISDIFFATMKSGKTTIGELSANIGKVAPLAAQLGVSFDEVGAAVATLTASGVSTSESMTQIQSVMSALVKVTPQATKEAERLGINFDLAELKSRGFAGFIKYIAEETGGSTEALGKLFGNIEGIKALLPLAGASSELYAENLEKIGNAAGATDESVATMQKTLGFRWGQTVSRIKDLAISFGDWLTPAINLALSAVEDLTGANDALLLSFAGLSIQKTGEQLSELGASIVETRRELDIYTGLVADGGAALTAYGGKVEELTERLAEQQTAYKEGLAKIKATQKGAGGLVKTLDELIDELFESNSELFAFGETAGGVPPEIDKATESITNLWNEIRSGTKSSIGLETIRVEAKKTAEIFKDTKSDIDDLFDNDSIGGFGDLGDTNSEVVETMRSGWERFKDSSTDSVAGFIRTGKMDLKSFGSFTLDILSQIAAKILTTFAFDKLGIGGGTSGGMFSGLSGLFGGDGAGGGIAKIFGKGGSIATMAGKVGTSISGGIGSMAASLGAAAPYAMAALAAGALLSKLFGGGRSAEEIFGDEWKEVQATKASGAFSAAALGSGLTLEGGGANVAFITAESENQLNDFANHVKSVYGDIEVTVQDSTVRLIGVSGSGSQAMADSWIAASDGISESMAGMSDNSIQVLEALREYGDRTGIELTEGFKEFALSGNASMEELSSGGIDSIEKLLDYWNNQEFRSKTGVFEIQTVGSSPSYAEALPPEYSVGTPLVTKTGGAIVHEGERILTKEQNKTYNNGGASDKAIYDLIDAIMMNQEARRV